MTCHALLITGAPGSGKSTLLGIDSTLLEVDEVIFGAVACHELGTAPESPEEFRADVLESRHGRRYRPSVDAVLFDFAGTLFMPRAATELVSRAAQTLGVEMAPVERAGLAEAYLAAGLPGGPYPARVPHDLVALYERRDMSSEAHRAAYVGLLSTVEQSHPGMAEAIYDQILHPGGWLPYADAQEVIEALQVMGVRVGLVSNVGFDLRPILRAHGFEQLARACTLSFEAKATKPDARIFRLALQTLGADAPRTLMVGDHAAVDGGAAALGIRTLILPMTPPGSTHNLKRILQLLS